MTGRPIKLAALVGAGALAAVLAPAGVALAATPAVSRHVLVLSVERALGQGDL